MNPTTTRIEKFLGLRSDVQPERMDVGDLIEAVNMRFDKTGQVFRRDGHKKQIPGLAHSLWGDGDLSLIVFNNALSRVNPDLSLTTLLPGLQPHRVVQFARVNDLVYWGNGVQSGVLDPGNNQTRSWGLPVPQVQQAELVSGNLPAGRYQYAVTFLRSDGQESGASTALVVDLPDGSGLQIEAPASADPDISRVVLYLSTAGGETLYRATDMAPGTPGSYRSNGLDLVAPLLTQFLTPPPASNVFAQFAGRLWLGVADAVFPSSPFSFELFDLQEYLPVTGNVTLLAPQPDQSGMWVGTDSHLLYLTGNDPRDMRIEVKRTEPMIPGSLVWVPGDKFGDGQFAGSDIPVWAGARGLYAGLPLPGGKVLALTEGRHPLELTGQGAAYFDRTNHQLVVSAV